MNKKNLLIILMISIGIAIFGLLMDDDIKEPSTIMRFVEFFAMTGILFIFLISINYLTNFAKKLILVSRNLLVKK